MSATNGQTMPARRAPEQASPAERHVGATTGAPRLALVMPVANELDTIAATHDRITALAEQGLADLVWIPVIDSVSRDGTREWLCDVAARDRRIHVVDLGAARGLAHAYLAGYAHARRLGAERIIEIDAGLSHPIERIPDMMRALDDHPIVYSTRLHRSGGFDRVPWRRRLLTRAGTWLARHVLGVTASDGTGGFIGMRRDVLRTLDLDHFRSRQHMVQTELKYYCRHLPGHELPIVYRGSGSTLRLDTLLDAARVLLRLLADRLHPRSPLATRMSPLVIDRTPAAHSMPAAHSRYEAHSRSAAHSGAVPTDGFAPPADDHAPLRRAS